MTADHGLGIDLPSIKGQVTKWSSGRITIRVDSAGRRPDRPGVVIDMEISPRDAKRLIAHLSKAAP